MRSFRARRVDLVLERELDGRASFHALFERTQLPWHHDVELGRPAQRDEQITVSDAELVSEEVVSLHRIRDVAEQPGERLARSRVRLFGAVVPERLEGSVDLGRDEDERLEHARAPERPIHTERRIPRSNPVEYRRVLREHLPVVEDENGDVSLRIDRAKVGAIGRELRLQIDALRFERETRLAERNVTGQAASTRCVVELHGGAS